MIYLTSVNSGENITVRELDQCLVRLAKQDTAALETLYYAVKDKVYGFALSMVKDPRDAEDVLHDLFVVIYQAAETYRSAGKPMAWILTITRNLCLQKLRQQKKTAALPEPMGEEITADLATDHAKQTEDKLVLQACMELLKEEERQILVLHAVSGLKHREIAEMLELSLPAVLSKYHRSIKKIKHFLEGRG